jgi:hypothetical protein
MEWRIAWILERGIKVVVGKLEEKSQDGRPMH